MCRTRPHMLRGVLFLHEETHLPRRINSDHSCFGRGDAHQRIHLYPVEGGRLRTIIGIHVSRSPKGMGGDQTTTGPREPSCFPVANHLTADAVSFSTMAVNTNFSLLLLFEIVLHFNGKLIYALEAPFVREVRTPAKTPQIWGPIPRSCRRVSTWQRRARYSG